MGMVEEGAGTSAAGRGRGRRLAGVAGLLGAVLLAAACMPALDPGFGGGDGVVTLAGDTASSDAPAAVAVQPDGRIVVLFESRVVGTYLTLARFNPDGSPDPSFGTNGRVAPGWIGFASCSDLVVQPDGGLLVSANIPSSEAEGGSVWGVGRFTPDGTLDTSFGTDGIASVGDGRPCDLHAQPDGKIVASLTDARAGFALARFRPDGGVDTGFGTDGIASIRVDRPMLQEATAVTVGPDGTIVAAGGAMAFGEVAPHHVVVARFRADGASDATFAGQGGLIADLGGTAEDVAVRPDGRILVMATVHARYSSGRQQFLLAQYGPTGALDGTFGTSGIARAVDDGDANDVELLADGSTLVIGGEAPDVYGPDPHDGFILVRHGIDGRRDAGFGTDGVSTTDHFDGDESASVAAVQPDGRLVVAGTVPSQADQQGPDVGIYRYDLE